MNTVRVCQGALDHRPTFAETDRHHIFPTYLCSLLGVAKRTETVTLCSACHDLAHHVLHHRINTGTVGGHHLPAGVAAIVETAWRWYVDVLT